MRKGVILVAVAAGVFCCPAENVLATEGASAVKVSSEVIEGKAGMQWVAFPAGTFMMGDNKSNFSNEKPRHRVAIKGFQIAKTLVTNKQYKTCVDEGACSPAHVADGTCYVDKGEESRTIAPGILADVFQGDDKPVVCIDWEQAKSFSQWVGGRLPTESEWEYAARSGGKEQKYPWGNKRWTCERATDGLFCPNAKRPMSVCSKPAGNTPQGLCDMAGNVGQWTQDWNHTTYFGAPDDGTAWDYPIPAADNWYGKVVRGSTAEFGSASTFRGFNSNPEISSYGIGIRPVR